MFCNMASNVSETDVYILFVKLSAILFSFAFVQLDKWQWSWGTPEDWVQSVQLWECAEHQTTIDENTC